MSTTSDAEFGMMLESPEAYCAHRKGFVRALAAGAPPDRAAQLCGLSPDELAGALGILKKVRRFARGAGRAALRAGVNPVALATHTAKFAARGLAAATAPIRRRIFKAFFGKLVTRRARLIAWTRRHSLQPTAVERKAARAWAAQYVKRRGLLGKLVGTALAGDVGAEPATTALITASIPVLVALAKRALKVAEREGAPADPRQADDADGIAPDE